MSHILRPKTEEKAEIENPIIVDLLRNDPDSLYGPQLQRYVVPYRSRMSAFTVLREIYENIDATIAFRNQQCGRGICGTCNMRIRLNGQQPKLVKGCTIPLKPGDQLTIYPSNQKKVIRDLVTTS